MTNGGEGRPKFENKAESELTPKTHLAAILAAQLTPDNIDTYFDTALNDLVHLAEELVQEYTQDHDVSGLSKREIEDLAFAHFDVQAIPDILTAISQRKEDLEVVDVAIQGKTKRVRGVIVPTTPRQPNPRAKSDFVPFESRKKEIKGRLKTLLYILKEEGADLEEVELVKGEVKRSMIRQESYVSVGIPSLNRLVLICDLEGNASFVFDTEGLAKTGVSVEDLPKMNKPELNDFIARYPDVAARVVFSQQWVADVRKLLNSPIGEVSNIEPQEQILKVATSELDPWRGFYTDPNGKHYGSIHQIVSKLGITIGGLSKYDLSKFESRYMQNLSGHLVRGYAFEDFDSIYRETLALPQQNLEEGEWQGFYEKDGKHYGTFNALFVKFNSVSIKTLNEKAAELQLVPIQIRDRFNKARDAYAYEDMKDAIEAITNVPVVNLEGEWKGFLERDGEHFGSVALIAARLGLAHNSVKTVIADTKKAGSLREISVRNAAGSVLEAYSLEEVSKIPKMKAFIESPQVAKDGEWKNFFEKDGKHWGTELALATRLGVDNSTVKKRVERNELPSIQIRTGVGTLKQAWAFEDIEPLVKK